MSFPLSMIVMSSSYNRTQILQILNTHHFVGTESSHLTFGSCYLSELPYWVILTEARSFYYKCRFGVINLDTSGYISNLK